MFCTKCGSLVEDGDAFCGNCGNRIEPEEKGKTEEGEIPEIEEEPPEKKYPLSEAKAARRKKIIKIIARIIISALIIVALAFGGTLLYKEYQSQKYYKQKLSFSDEFKYDGTYLIESAEFVPELNQIKNIQLSPNNFEKFDMLDESEFFSDVCVVEAQVIADLDNGRYELGPGIEIGKGKIGDRGMWFNYARMKNSEMVISDGEKYYSVSLNEFPDRPIQRGKIYNIRCEVYGEVYDSYLRYKDGKFVPVTANDVKAQDVNCAWENNEMYIAYSSSSSSSKWDIYRDFGAIDER